VVLAAAAAAAVKSPPQVWVDHGNPGSRLLPVSPVDLHDGSVRLDRHCMLSPQGRHQRPLAPPWPMIFILIAALELHPTHTYRQPPGGAMDGHADIVTCMLCRSSANCRTERWRSDCGTASKMAAARINHLTASGSHHPSMMMLRAQSVDLAELRGA
jgi:hypothetical protein